MRRVVITGIGAVCPHGLTITDFWNGLTAMRSGIAPLSAFDPTTFPSRVSGQVSNFKTTDFVPKSYRKATKIMARDIELAVVAADGAVRDAHLATRGVLETFGGKTPDASWFEVDPRRLGCNIGAGLICADLNELTSAMALAKTEDGGLSLQKWGRSDDPTKPSGMDLLTPLWLLKYLPNMLACHVSIIHDAQGPSNTITCQQASAGLALTEACRTIQRGQADMALVGGCESMVHPMGLMRWTLLNRLTTSGNESPAGACRPMDQAATGTVIAEGGSVLIVEELEQAQKRRVKIYAEVVGLGASSSARGIAGPDPAGEAMAMAMRKALKSAGTGATEVQLVVPCGYAIASHDQAEEAALNSVFGTHHPEVLPIRGGIGDAGAGTQALDLAAAAMALYHQTIPGAVNCVHPIGGLNVPQQTHAAVISHALINTGSIAGQNSAVVLRRYV
ncbi:MAG: beta-ketoacyl-[acyl-carrier-protein] synthase family protein [Phycisphaerae bacterium]